MTREFFYGIFDQLIVPEINRLAHDNPLLDVKDLGKCKEDIYDRYQELKDLYKNQIFNKTDEALLDRHKIASCLCAAFLQVSVFNKQRLVDQIVETKAAMESYLYYVNEGVALYAATRVLSFFMVMDYRKNHRIQDEIRTDFPLMPPIVKSKKGFWNSLLFNLACIKDKEMIGLEHFDIYAYAVIFFMLEVYYIEKKQLWDKADSAL